MKNVEEAVDRAVMECINEGILREFLLQNRKEAVSYTHLDVYKRQRMILINQLSDRTVESWEFIDEFIEQTQYKARLIQLLALCWSDRCV